MSKVTRYRDLRVWQEGVELSVYIYRVTNEFSKTEQFGLTSQMRRAAVSVPSNIAEGFNRSTREFGRFLQIALGSLAELETQIEIAVRIGYLAESGKSELCAKTDQLGRQLNVLYQRVSSTSN